MGLLGRKKDSSIDEKLVAEQLFFDETFREELRNHGRWYFEKVINENGALFKQQLDATAAEINTEVQQQIAKQLSTAIAQISHELKDHVTKQLYEQFAEDSQTMQEAHNSALQSITGSVQALQQQHQQLVESLQKSVAEHEATLSKAFDENKAQITKMKDTQKLALDWLASSIKALQDQHQQLTATLQKNVAAQETMLVDAFEQNMARVIENYLLGALGDQYDLKAQLPAIVKQMEANKQAMVDDIKL